jgi:hypothetical protein
MIWITNCVQSHSTSQLGNGKVLFFLKTGGGGGVVEGGLRFKFSFFFCKHLCITSHVNDCAFNFVLKKLKTLNLILKLFFLAKIIKRRNSQVGFFYYLKIKVE